MPRIKGTRPSTTRYGSIFGHSFLSHHSVSDSFLQIILTWHREASRLCIVLGATL
ncbi:MAG: hypothetical protein JWN98_2734 [Abditibacteriota bacterium]|nr:hypothetical protein [Abditibacteriota bacterium]